MKSGSIVGGNPFALVSILVIAGLTPRAALAENAPGWKFCQSDNDTPEVRAITDCTGLIDAGDLNENDRAIAYYRRGAAYWRKEDLDQAAADETKAIELDPNIADAYVRRGASYLNKGDIKSAIADYRTKQAARAQAK